MGASNALSVYRTYGPLVGDRALRILIYMALVSRDRDSEPWCSIGHEALSEFALNHAVPGREEIKDRRRVLRVVERAMTELADVGAVRTIKRATYSRHGVTPARYRLYLNQPCADTRKPCTTRQKSTGNPPVRNRREAQVATRQISVSHPSENGAPPVTQRRTKEYEETGGAINTGVLQSTRVVEGTAVTPPAQLENPRMSAIEAAAWAAVALTNPTDRKSP